MKEKVAGDHRDWAGGFPPDLLASIFSRLETADLLESAQWVCRSWRDASKIPSAFQSIRLNSFYPRSDRLSENRVCGLFAEAARRSNAHHLTELDITSRSFSDELLMLVTSRTTRLRRLRLHGCCNINDKGLTESAPNLPLLEDLQIVDCFYVSKPSVEAVGKCCPLLQVFKFSSYRTMGDEVYAIASTMPGLLHLVMPGDSTEEGVEAILKGCPNLEHLDLFSCFNLFPGKESVSRWRKRVKNLVLPEHAFDEDPDYDYDDLGFYPDAYAYGGGFGHEYLW